MHRPYTAPPPPHMISPFVSTQREVRGVQRQKRNRVSDESLQLVMQMILAVRNAIYPASTPSVPTVKRVVCVR